MIANIETQVHAVRAHVRAFVDDVVIPRESEAPQRDVEALDRLIAELRSKAQADGLFAPQLWNEWKDQGTTWRMRQALLEEAGRSPLGPGAMHCAAPDAPNMDLLDQLASPTQRQKYLQPLLAAECRSCFAMTEPAPGAGSDPSMILTKAVRTQAGWVLNGHKWFISGAVDAKFSIVVAVADEGPTLFLVDTANPGWQLQRNLRSLEAMHIGGHGEIRIVDCLVDDDSVLGEPGRALEYAQLRLEPARVAHCMRMMGRAERVMELAESYVLHRQSFRSELGSLQAVQTMVADSRIDLHAARLLTANVAARMDAGESVKQESAIAKVFVSEALGRIADRAVQLAGASGTLADEPIGQFYEEVRPFRIYDGASEVHRIAIGRRALKERSLAISPSKGILA